MFTHNVAKKLINNGVRSVTCCKDCIYCLDRKKYLRCVRFGFRNGHGVTEYDYCIWGEEEEKK